MVNGNQDLLTGDSNLLKVGKRAVDFQEFLLRRAWAYFYGVWAIDILLNLIGSAFFQSYGDIVFTVVTLFSGYFVSIEVFRKSLRLGKYRRLIEGQGLHKGKGLSNYFLIGLIIYFAIAVVISTYIIRGVLAGYIIFLGFIMLIFLASIVIFLSSWEGLQQVTVENAIATSSLLLGGVLDIIFNVFEDQLPQAFGLLIWGTVISLLIVASMVSFYHSTEVLGYLGDPNE